MKQIFKVKIKFDNEVQAELLFDDKDRAERFMNAISQILTVKGKKEVEFIPEICSLIDCDEDILESFDS